MKASIHKKIPFGDKLNAFTIAEILIVLCIIGFLAEMTIPTLISNVQELQYKSAAKEAYSKATQALQQMRMDNGGTLSNYFTWKAFTPVFKTFFKINGTQYYVSRTYDAENSNYPLPGYKKLDGNPFNRGDLMDDGQFVTDDGMFWMIENAYGPIYITVDINGYNKNPNIFGKDTFMFQIKNENLLPMGAKGTDFSATSYCNKNAVNSAQGMGCMYNVMQGIDY